MTIDRILLGHNQFIGVDHFSQERARNKASLFKDNQRILDILDTFLEQGERGMMLSTHPKSREILAAISTKPELSNNINIYPLIPYAQGYIRKANEQGLVTMITDSLSAANTSKKLKILFKGGMGYLKKDHTDILSTMIDLELLTFNKFNTRSIFLHNILTDLALAFNAENIFEFYIDYIKENYNATPAFGTVNFVKLVEAFEEWGLPKPLVMSSFNKIGFQMNPSMAACEECLKSYSVDVLAMSTLASGYIPPKEAYEYLFSLPNIKSVVVGVSTKEHAYETINLIHSHLGNGQI